MTQTFALPESHEPLAYLNGDFVLFEQAKIPIWDLGFTQGVTVTDHMRTVDGKIRLLGKHLARLQNSLNIVGIKPAVSVEQVGDIATALVDHHRRMLADDEIGIGVCMTPGPDPRLIPPMAKSNRSSSTLIYSYRLPIEQWEHFYSEGLHLQIVETREIPDNSIPRALKHRSRMHYYLAEQQAERLEPQSRALLLDVDGNLAEATTASVILVVDDKLIAPPTADVLTSITAEHTFELARNSKLAVERRKISPEEIFESASEVLWLSTTATIFPVTRVNGKKIGTGRPGHVYEWLSAAWDGE